MAAHQHQDAEAPPPPPPPPISAGPAAEDPLLLRPPPVAADGHDHLRLPRRAADRSFPWLTVLGFGFLTLNSGMAIYRSHGEPRAVGFVAFSYADLLLLFVCLRRFEGAEPGSAARDRLKVAVWVLTTALTLLFSSKVAAVMPAVVAVVVWVMAFGTVAGGFYAFFCHGGGGDEKP